MNIEHKLPYAIAIQSIDTDFDFFKIMQNVSAFGADEFFYIGKKAVARYHSHAKAHPYYSNIQFVTIDDLKLLKNKYVFVGLENNVERTTTDIKSFDWPKNSLIIVGEDEGGISSEILALCDFLVHINMYGSVRSIYANCASAIAMYDYTTKFYNKE